MTHVFVAPHPDDAALSCGGLISSLRELGQNVTILSVYSGTATEQSPAGYREALGFGTKALWPNYSAFNRSNILNDYPTDNGPDAAPPWAATEENLEATQADADASAKRFWQRSSWYRRASIRNESLAGQLVIDELPTQGAVVTDEVMEAAAAGDPTARRRIEDERYAYFAEAGIVFLDLPDAIYRGYDGEDQLLGRPREDDPAPYETLRREIARLEPQKVYFPLGIGGHVDHRLCREVGLQLLRDGHRWIMPGPDYAGALVFYEDFPYAWWNDFAHLGDLDDGGLVGLPSDVGIAPQYADVGDQIESKIMGVSLYASQLERLFGGRREMARAVRAFGQKVAALGGREGFAERYWASDRI